MIAIIGGKDSTTVIHNETETKKWTIDQSVPFILFSSVQSYLDILIIII